ncbi:hypothetical protein RRG08_039819 [Elysia crispata]|uniref:Uncharacterized protein n=1 Tax=Elysia crispata TaxID=231223 RepID=A0AAE1ANH0_9GAST|nr:hypothetical protein RRG08_039819 [Elysia crispata]
MNSAWFKDSSRSPKSRSDHPEHLDNYANLRQVFCSRTSSDVTVCIPIRQNGSDAILCIPVPGPSGLEPSVTSHFVIVFTTLKYFTSGAATPAVQPASYDPRRRTNQSKTGVHRWTGSIAPGLSEKRHNVKVG